MPAWIVPRRLEPFTTHLCLSTAVGPARRIVPMREPPPPSAYVDRFLEDMRRRLLWVSSRAWKDFGDLAASALEPMAPDSLDSPADRGSEEYAEEMNVGLLETESDLLFEIEEALARIDGRGEYTYGLCDRCREEPRHLCKTCPWIPKARLRYMPWARNCAKAQEELDGSKREE